MIKKYAFVQLSSVINSKEEFDKVTADIKSDSNNYRVRKVVKYNPDFVYARFKAIGSLEIDGPNANADGFPYVEFLDTRAGYGYQSFIGKHAFIEHASDNINNAIGDLYAAYLNRFDLSKYGNREWNTLRDDERAHVLAIRQPHEDGSIEVLMAVDRKRAPKIARMIETDSPTGCSMGTNIDYSECTICGNRAYTEEGYCPHIKFSKGQHLLIPASQTHDLIKKGALRSEWLPHIFSRPEDIKAVRKGGRKMVYAKAFEVNYGLSFFELSVVANPAFNRGYKLEKVANMSKPSFKQLLPIIYESGQPVEVILNVSDEYYDNLLNSHASSINKPVESWTKEEQIMFLRNGNMAKDALAQGNVQEVLVSKRDAPALIETADLQPSNDSGFYRVENPINLLRSTFANLRLREKKGAIGSLDEDFYACAVCRAAFDRKTNQKVAGSNLKSFTALSICPKCENKFKGDIQIMARKKEAQTPGPNIDIGQRDDKWVVIDQDTDKTLGTYGTREEALDQMQAIYAQSSKKAVYESEESGGLPSTSEFTGDKDVEAREGETELWHGWAEKGSKQIEKEKEYRPMGTIFIDAISARQDLNSRSFRIAELIKSANTLIERTKLAIHSPEDFLKEMDKEEPGKPAELAEPAELVEPEEGVEGVAIALEFEAADLPTVLENTKKDLLMVLEDLQAAKDMVNGQEEEAKEALANKLRWGKRQAYATKKIAEQADDLIGDAEAAIEDALGKLERACQVIYEDEDKDKDKDEDKDEDVENKEINKDTDEGDDDMSKEARLDLSEKQIELLAKIANIYNQKTARGDYDEEQGKKRGEQDTGPDEYADKKKEEKKEMKEKKEKKEKKEEKKEAKKVTSAQDKEATAMPPTGARDPGDYGEPGAVESVEMQTWWKEMYPEFEQIKRTEEQKSLNDPETKVELLTGYVGNATKEEDQRPGEAGNAPAIYARRFVNKFKPMKSFYGVVKTAEDGSVEAFTANFSDVTGAEDEGFAQPTEKEYDTFLSNGYRDEIVESVKQHGVEATRKEMGGKIAQLENITPGKTEKVNPLYDTQEDKKDSNEPREGLWPSAEMGHGKGADKEYYSKAYGDSGYASDLVQANKKIAALEKALKDKEQKVAKMQIQAKSNVLAQRALHLARVAASRGVIEFDLPNVEAQAKEYIQLDDNAYMQVKSHLEKLPVKNQRALEAYQIPEAENMGAGVVHNTLDAVRNVRYEQGKGEDVAPEGIQPAVENNAKIEAEKQKNIRKQANQPVPQMHMNNADAGGSTDVSKIDMSKYFNRSIVTQLRKKGKLDEAKEKGWLKSNRNR